MHLPAASTAEDALSEIVLGAVRHLRANEACVIARAHEEGVHQMRVAARRLRSCLALFARFIPQEQHDYLATEIKWLIGELGPARDHDVFVGQVLGPVLSAIDDEERLSSLAKQIDRHHDDSYASARIALTSQRYLGLMLLLASWAEGRGWRELTEEADAPNAMQASALDVSRDLLQDIHAQALAAGQDFETLDARARHKVRIALKKLRYATEFFESLYVRRKVSPYLAALKALQDDLGASNDIDVARKLLKGVLKPLRGKHRAQLAYAAGLIVGWHSHLTGDRERTLVQNWQRFVARQPFWTPAGAVRPGATSSVADNGAAPPQDACAAPEAEEHSTADAPASPPDAGIAATGKLVRPARFSARPSRR